jgi:peptide deformylase
MNETPEFKIAMPKILLPSELPTEIKKRTLPLVEETDSILHTVMPAWDFANPPTDALQLAYDLTETMKKKNGIGLAANQVGYNYRVFVMNTYPQVFVCFNPRIVNVSDETILLEEGCLSYPNLWVKIRRSKTVKVRFTLPNGETVTHTFDGLTARVFQHELDHLNGIIFYSRAFISDRKSAMTRRKQLNRK